MAQIRISAFVISFSLCAGAASGQLHEVTRSSVPSFGVGIESGAAYDPIHDCYFVISGAGSVTGRFINRDGTTIGAVSFDARGGFADVAYSPDVPDGAGGFGGFLTIWALEALPGLFGQIATLPAGLVGAPVAIRPTYPAGYEFKGGVAYSPVDHVFLVAVGEYPFGVNNGRLPTRIIRLNQSAQPLDDIQLSLNSDCPNLEFSHACNHVDVVWNPISNEFGVLYGDGRNRSLARVSGNGAVLSRIPLGISRAWGALSVNAATGNYLAIGGAGGLSFGPELTDGAEVSAGGAILARGFITASLETDAAETGWMRLSYSAVSGTFLLSGVGTDHLPRLLELNQHGVPVGAMLVLASFAPAIVSHPAAPHWLAAAFDARYIIGTSTPFGGSDARLSNCTTPDPFVAFGGGRCVNDGWYPPVASPPPAVAGSCITPDPFVALGGGRCVNGGWYPPSAPPPPSPVPGGCITPDPFVALGGGTCVSGGWYPPVVAVPPPPPPVPGGCVTPDPFVAFGGGRCVNGGWYLPGS